MSETELARREPHPGLALATPEEIVLSPCLSWQEKIDVLRSRQYDVAELAVAEEEGMVGPENDQLPRILNALAQLTGGEDAEFVAPTKQHGLV
jgi:hypothetical protein